MTVIPFPADRVTPPPPEPELTAYGRTMLIATAYTTQPCPRCKVPAGEWCQSSGGYRNSLVRHVARHRLVDGWDDQRKLAESIRAGVFRRRTP